MDIKKFAESKGVKAECLQKGFDDERSEHPTFTDEQVATVAADHLKMDAKYYAEDDDEEEDYKSAKKGVYKSKHAMRGED